MHDQDMNQRNAATATEHLEQAREAWQKPVLSRAEIRFDTAYPAGSNNDAHGGSQTSPGG
jgi:hypothetical protein